MSFASPSSFQTSVNSPLARRGSQDGSLLGSRRGSLSSTPGSRRGSLAGLATGSPVAAASPGQAPFQFRPQQPLQSVQQQQFQFQPQQQQQFQFQPQQQMQFQPVVPNQGGLSPRAASASVSAFQPMGPVAVVAQPAPAPAVKVKGAPRALNYKTVGRVKRPDAEKLELILRRAIDRADEFRQYDLTREIDGHVLYQWIVGTEGVDPKQIAEWRERFVAPFYSSDLIKTNDPEGTYNSLKRASAKVRLVTDSKVIPHPFLIDGAGNPLPLHIYTCGSAVKRERAVQLVSQIGYRMGRIVPLPVPAGVKIDQLDVRPENLMSAWECSRNKTILSLTERIQKKRQKSAAQLQKHRAGLLWKDANCAHFARADTPGAKTSLECSQINAQNNIRILQQQKALQQQISDLQIEAQTLQQQVSQPGVGAQQYEQADGRIKSIHAEIAAIRSNPDYKKILAKRIKA